MGLGFFLIINFLYVYYDYVKNNRYDKDEIEVPRNLCNILWSALSL